MLSISDLPDTLLADVGSYLPAPSRALLAVAMGASSPERGRQADLKPSASGDATTPALLCGENWEVLDFAEIEKSLASRLTDHDIHDILVCIGAATRLKRLKLAGCLGISGRGLEPLRGSTVLEQIDISLVSKGQSPDIEPEPMLLEGEVFPVLMSIVDAEGCSLQHVQLPKGFTIFFRPRGRTARDLPRNPSFQRNFRNRYNELLSSRQSSCSRCHGAIVLPYAHGSEVPPFESAQNYTCYECTRLYCDECKVRDGHKEVPFLDFCSNCERYLCLDCESARSRGTCEICSRYVCRECGDVAACTSCVLMKQHAQEADEIAAMMKCITIVGKYKKTAKKRRVSKG